MTCKVVSLGHWYLTKVYKSFEGGGVELEGYSSLTTFVAALPAPEALHADEFDARSCVRKLAARRLMLS